MLTKKEKIELVKNLEKDFKAAKGIVFAQYHGLTVAQIQELRKKLKKEKVSFKVLKKTLLSRALNAANKRIDLEQLPGPIACAYSKEDEALPAKLLFEFSKLNPALKLIGGFENMNWLDKVGATALAQIPSKDILLGQFVRAVAAPVSGFMQVLAGNLRNLVYVLKAVADKKQ